jgi:ABC-type transport system substrate-binding protein
MASILRIILLLFLVGFVGDVDAARVLQIPLNAKFISLDPRYMQDVSSLLVSRQINCQLIRNQGGVYSLEAAKSIKYYTPLKILIEIDKNKKFADGSRVTANDVVASFNYIKNERGVLRNIFAWVEEVKALDDNRILFTLKKPIPQFLTVLSGSNYAIFKEDFLKKSMNDNALWRMPLGCGGYKITEVNEKYVDLKPIHSGFPIRFILNNSNQVQADQIDKYDIINLAVVGESSELENYKKIEIFDPSQLYIGLNSSSNHWKNQSNRCAFLSKIDIKNLQKTYGDRAQIANDFVPQGVIGYAPQENYFLSVKEKYQSHYLPKRNLICFAYLVGSIPKQYRKSYINMLRSVYPNIEINPIDKAKQFGSTFIKMNCDVLVYSLKSNNLDAYEYLNVFSNDDANFSAYHDQSLSTKIENSQSITDPARRASAYRSIIKKIESLCLVRPLLTIPNRIIYVRSTLKTPGIGEGPLNDYYLGYITG